MKFALAVLFAFSLGAMTRWLGLPVPAPPKVSGVVLILAVTVGYIATDRLLGARAPAGAEQPPEGPGGGSGAAEGT